MSKAEPKLQKFMTDQPHSIESNRTLKEAQSIMSQYQIRHLPVIQAGQVTGVISDRDIKNACSLRAADADKMKVSDIAHEHPYVTHPDALLHEVADEMAEKRYGCAIVVQNGKLVGIFTTVDACRALSSVLQTKFHNA